MRFDEVVVLYRRADLQHLSLESCVEKHVPHVEQEQGVHIAHIPPRDLGSRCPTPMSPKGATNIIRRNVRVTTCIPFLRTKLDCHARIVHICCGISRITMGTVFSFPT